MSLLRDCSDNEKLDDVERLSFTNSTITALYTLSRTPVQMSASPLALSVSSSVIIPVIISDCRRRLLSSNRLSSRFVRMITAFVGLCVPYSLMNFNVFAESKKPVSCSKIFMMAVIKGSSVEVSILASYTDLSTFVDKPDETVIPTRLHSIMVLYSLSRNFWSSVISIMVLLSLR